MSRLERPWLRSMLYVPGHKTDWIVKAVRHGADSLILDLEDAEPAHMKQQARASVPEALASNSLGSTRVYVRVNGWGTGDLIADVLAVAGENVSGFVLAKTSSSRDVHGLDLLLSDIEHRDGIAAGHFEIVPLLETAGSVEFAYDILNSSSRIARVSAPAGLTPGQPGDLHRSLGVDATEECDEMLYVGSRILVAARAAGLDHILGGMTLRINDEDLLRRSLARAKQHGATGSMAIHPSQIATIHDAFTPSASEIDAAAGLIAALGAAYDRGDAAVLHDGAMIDRAHVRSALKQLERARSCGLSVPTVPLYADWLETTPHT